MIDATARFAIALSATLCVANISQACTTVLLGAPGHTRLAYSYDFVTGAGAILINGRGAERHSVLAVPADIWPVRHASVTFNQFGPGLPTTGMNDAGLVVTLMWNEGVEFPAPTGAPSIGELELIQRLLDTSETVGDAIEEARSVHVPGMVPIHYFVTDRAGGRAVLAHQEGTLTVHADGEVPISALTNLDYDMLVANYLSDPVSGYAVGQSDDLNDLSGNSLGRFAAAASAITDAGPNPSLETAFDTLEDVANELTQWNIVYDPVDGTVAFRMGATGAMHSLDLNAVDLECQAQPLGIVLADLGSAEPEVSLEPFDEAATLSLIRDVYPVFPPTDAFLPPSAHAAFATQITAATRCP